MGPQSLWSVPSLVEMPGNPHSPSNGLSKRSQVTLRLQCHSPGALTSPASGHLRKGENNPNSPSIRAPTDEICLCLTPFPVLPSLGITCKSQCFILSITDGTPRKPRQSTGEWKESWGVSFLISKMGMMVNRSGPAYLPGYQFLLQQWLQLGFQSQTELVSNSRSVTYYCCCC